MTLLSLVSVYTVVIFLVQLGSCSSRCPITYRQSQSCLDTGCPLFRAAAEAHVLCSPPRKKGVRPSSALITQETRTHTSSRQQLSVKRRSRRPRPTALQEAFLAVHPASIFFGSPWTKICWFIIFFGIWSSLKSMQTGHLFAHQLCAPFSVQFIPNCSQRLLFSIALRFVSDICLQTSRHAVPAKHHRIFLLNRVLPTHFYITTTFHFHARSNSNFILEGKFHRYFLPEWLAG